MATKSDAVYLRGHQLFVSYLQRNGLGHLETFFPADMTLGQLRELTYEEIENNYVDFTDTDRKRLASLLRKVPLSRETSLDESVDAAVRNN